MIAYVRGILAEKSPERAVVEASGVGYAFQIPLGTYDRLPRPGEEVKMLACHIVREDDESLFGFASEAERELFVKLTGVSGVGPRIALAILSSSSPGELSMAIAAGDSKRISAVRGVGRKTAEKICLELKDKIDLVSVRGAVEGEGIPAAVRDAVAALRALGFGEEASSKMVADAVSGDRRVNDVEQIIKLALSKKGKLK